MRHGLSRSLIVLAVFAASFGLFWVIAARSDGEQKSGLLGLLQRLHLGDRGSAAAGGHGNRSGSGFTLADSRLLERPPSVLDEIDRATSSLVESVMPSVVRIDTTRKVKAPLSGAEAGDVAHLIEKPFFEPGLGSGVIISKEGHVITNYHVLAGVDEITIRTSDGSEWLGTQLGFDADMDIALLKIEDPDGREFQPLPFAEKGPEIGHMVMAVGSPMGLTNSVTTGIVSGRYNQQDETAVSLFQTTAIINPGSSGGPLINSRGELVGINTALYAVDPDKQSSWQGIGLATPSDDALHVFHQIMREETPDRLPRSGGAGSSRHTRYEIWCRTADRSHDQ